MIRDNNNQPAVPNKHKHIDKAAVYGVGHGKKDGSNPVIGILDTSDPNSGMDSVNIVQIKGDTLPNGNVLYNGFTIVRSGKPGTDDKFEYEIVFVSNFKTSNNIGKLLKAPKFNSAEDAIKYIDRNGLRVSYE